MQVSRLEYLGVICWLVCQDPVGSMVRDEQIVADSVCLWFLGPFLGIVNPTMGLVTFVEG